MTKIGEEILEELEDIREMLYRRHENGKITDEDVQQGTDAINKIKGLIC